MEHELRQNIYYELRWNILPCNNLKQEILRNKKITRRINVIYYLVGMFGIRMTRFNETNLHFEWNNLSYVETTV